MPAMQRLDVGKTTDGVWFSFTARDLVPIKEPVPNHICVRVARWNNPAHRAAKQKAYEPFLDEYKLGKATETTATEAETEAIADAILIDWRGVTEEDQTTEIPHSRAKAIETLLDKQLYEFRYFVIEAATTSRNFVADATARAEGNLSRSSSGS